MVPPILPKYRNDLVRMGNAPFGYENHYTPCPLFAKKVFFAISPRTSAVSAPCVKIIQRREAQSSQRDAEAVSFFLKLNPFSSNVNFIIIISVLAKRKRLNAYN